MLSRVANSIYWMCRYIERAENVARFISVNLNLLLDMPSKADKQWAPLIMTTGDQEVYEKQHEGYTGESVVRFLTFDREYSSSIVSCLYAARENARSIREIISSAMWEHLNNYYLEITDPDIIPYALNEPDEFFKRIQMNSHLFYGLMDGTMSHGEAWNFAHIGMMLERADKTSRILDVKYFMLLPRVELVNTPLDNIQWMAVLNSISAYEMFRKKYHLISPRNVAEFLIFNPDFPRSIKYCVSRADDCLQLICGTTRGTITSRVGKFLGRLKANLDFTDIDEVIAQGMHEYLDNLQTRLNTIDQAVGTTFFNIEPVQETATQEQ